MLKESDNPPISWPQERSIREFEGTWWVAHTKSRNEKALAHDLIVRQISYFLPMTWKTTRRRNRKYRTLLPLFSGYLFFCGSEVDRLELLRTHRVATVIDVTDQELLLNELLQIEQAIEVGAPLEPHQYIKKGQKCRVTVGPLEGLEGVVVRTRGTMRLVLQVDMLGQAASVETDTDMIEIIDEQD